MLKKMEEMNEMKKMRKTKKAPKKMPNRLLRNHIHQIAGVLLLSFIFLAAYYLIATSPSVPQRIILQVHT